MGTQLFPLGTSTSPSLPYTITNSLNSRFSYTIRRRSIRSRPPGRNHWDSYTAETIQTGRCRFNIHDEFLEEDGDEEDFDFTNSAKQRVWWSDDESEIDDVEDEEYWIFKVLGAFGWMVPAITISMLLGTGSNAFIMAIALPLGQRALSLAIDKVWGRTSSNNRKPSSRHRPRTRTRTKKKPFTRAASNIVADEERVTSYPSWVGSNYRSVKKNASSSFGGWDELVGNDKIPKRRVGVPIQKGQGPPRQQSKKNNLSRRLKNSTPLLLRLLIAVFPFLGSWTRLL